MIELFLSTDGKHTVHVTANTPEEMATLAPKAKALYKKVLEEFGTKRSYKLPLADEERLSLASLRTII